jgi:hypothetical protein
MQQKSTSDSIHIIMGDEIYGDFKAHLGSTHNAEKWHAGRYLLL